LGDAITGAGTMCVAGLMLSFAATSDRTTPTPDQTFGVWVSNDWAHEAIRSG